MSFFKDAIRCANGVKAIIIGEEICKLISISPLLLIIDANQNFSKAADRNKTVIAIENNKSACTLTKFREVKIHFS